MIRSAALLLFLLFGLGTAATASPVITKHVEAELVSASRSVAPGALITVALKQKIIPGWHTYWRNPGDAGQATSLTWTLPTGWSASDILWPAPERFVSGPLMNYVFSDQVYLPVQIQVPANAQKGRAELKATADWLVCKDVCVPEQAKLSMTINVGAAAASGPAAATPDAAAIKAVYKELCACLADGRMFGV